MVAASYFGYVLVALSAALMAWHWQEWRAWSPTGNSRHREHVRRQLQRRCVASALIGVVGAAMTLAKRMPPQPFAMTAYLCALLLAGCVIFLIAIADWRSTRRHRDEEQLAMLAEELRKATAELAQVQATTDLANRRG
jgi:hypothetical protein